MDPALAEAARPWILAWGAALGAVLGSFVNVVVARVPAGQSVVRPRSRCPRCGAAIAWYDNLPVVSWLLLRARCRGCRAPISFRYPLVELLGGAAGWLAFSRHGFAPAAFAELLAVQALLALAFIDLDTWLLPNALTWPLLAGGLALGALGLTAAPSFTSAAAGAAVGFLSFGAISVVGEKVFRKEALGFGDVWLLAALGAWHGLAALLPVVLLASLQGSIVGLALIALGRSQPGPVAAPLPPVDAQPAQPAQPVAAQPAGAQPDSAPGAELPPAVPPEAGPDRSPEAPGPAPASEPGPDATPVAPAAPEDDWVPPRHAVPFGPFLVLGGLEWLYLSRAIADVVPALGLFR